MDVHLERMEAELFALDGQKVTVRQPLAGTVEIAFSGKLIFQMNSADEPQFIVMREGNPGVVLVFQAFDVELVYGIKDPNLRQIVLKKAFAKTQDVV